MNTGTGGDETLLLAGLAACFVAVALLVVAVASLSRAGSAPDWARRIDRYRASRDDDEAPGERPHPARRALAAGEWTVRSGEMEDRVAHRLDQAGMSLRPHEWVLVRVGVTLVLAVAVTLLSGAAFGGLLGALLGWLGTRAYLASRTRRRLTAFSDQLPGALALVAGSLRSGFTVSQALERLARQDLQPLGAEMSRAVAETRLGASVEDALDKVADRMVCPDLSWIVLAVRIQREVGGNLAEVIDTTVETMRERTRLRRQIRALSAEGRLTAYVLIALPVVLAALMMLMRPDYMRPLFTEPLGVLMLVAGVVALLVGWVWMSRVIKVEA
ncbi:type II secretion system F family protein [Thermomonospora umbrina]|uniref:Tight adherence protein B n=1 Tax=Thermomonospora umbrina TaxID=111806 RepID=A0A3D9SLK7_9ACTN|nr:type II secretion system F family protein [Thermomonospora umbrina]REE96816.1 tight adherence protein B [Thermomonospora umbrina]